ncbi:hypothetical protein Tco_1414123 [Tanacetum coccineum]
MGDANPIYTFGDYSKPIHEGYRNTIELPAGNNVVPLQFDTIRLVQNKCSFHGLRFKDPNQHLKDFLKLMDSLDLDDENRERTRRTAKLRNNILMFQRHQGESLSKATGLVYDWEEGTITFEKDKEKSVYKMPHKMELFKHIDYTDIKTDRIPHFVIESDDDDSKKNHYSDSLDLGPEYKHDENVCRAI